MSNPDGDGRQRIVAIPVHQWCAEWNAVDYDPNQRRAKPSERFYMFTLNARTLKRLTGIHRRVPESGVPRSDDLGIQRRHDAKRSDQIAEFIRYGYPWSELSRARRESGEFADLRKPGWLPTAIVVNLRKLGEQADGTELAPADAVEVACGEEGCVVLLPEGAGPEWSPSRGSTYPIEVIDGQHRLWAFEEENRDLDFELPVVAFDNLDVSWQAYLFWSINITPKKINASMAFDLYPLLRTEDWLERFDGHMVYRETRAQELVDLLWRHPESAWRDRINMLGETGQKPALSQAAWVRGLMASYVRSYSGSLQRPGGLFGGRTRRDHSVLPWTRCQQAAFLIVLWREFREAVSACQQDWAVRLRERAQPSLIDDDPGQDPAFYGQHALICQDPGVRAINTVSNDVFWWLEEVLDLREWTPLEGGDVEDDTKAVSDAIKSLDEYAGGQIIKRMRAMAQTLVSGYDWRSLSALSEQDDPTLRSKKASLRGSGGYSILRTDLLKVLAQSGGELGETADEILELQE